MPDAYMLGKALGGGIMPVSAVVSTRDVLGVCTPAHHGTTFGGNPLACAVGRAVIGLLGTGEFQDAVAVLGAQLLTGFRGCARARFAGPRPRSVGRIEFTSLPGREACERLAAHGVLAKDTHGAAIRLAPPLMITEPELDWALDQLEAAIRE